MIKVLLFAGLAESVGSTVVELPAEELTVEDIRGILSEQYPRAKDLLDQCMVAVNEEYAHSELLVSASDEIAFIPPVSGG